MPADIAQTHRGLGCNANAKQAEMDNPKWKREPAKMELRVHRVQIPPLICWSLVLSLPTMRPTGSEDSTSTVRAGFARASRCLAVQPQCTDALHEPDELCLRVCRAFLIT